MRKDGNDDEYGRVAEDGVGVSLDEEGLSSQSIGTRTIDREAIENLRAYILFLEEMSAKYLLDEPLVAHREQRVR